MSAQSSSPLLFTRKQAFLDWRASLPASARVGLVPTMGALHEGHASLFRKARHHPGLTQVVGTIFVNPTQFGPSEDLAQYPRSLAQDLALLASLGTLAPDVVFAPENAGEVYANGVHQTWVTVDEVSAPLCGKFRAGHFRGVATVVLKLIHLAGAHAAFFGEKDFQQLAVIRQMGRDLDLKTEVVGCATIRENDGLALSSRNAYLSADERKQAPLLFEILRELGSRMRAAQYQKASEIEMDGLALLRARFPAFQPQYLEARLALTLDTLAPDPATWPRQSIVIAAAGYLGRTRLIEHVVVESAIPTTASQ
ncbi:MAG: pantoate--beta-alanine ligase [Bdellovibrionota bacterium]